ncbi:MAG: 50S ribosomal protein L5 [Gammaproteobacteria bacterium]|nr:50S ribosomal protein L5 [Gammaproteobacteria bacterium]
MARLKEFFKNTVSPELQKKLNLSNVMQIPEIKKVVLNIGVGNASTDKKIVQTALDHLSRIAGQKAVVTKARKSIAGFKIRDGWPLGVKVTLRKNCMYEFLDRVINITLPRVRDFRGVDVNGFDRRGNFNFSFKELVFPELDLDELDPNVSGMNVTIVTSARTDLHAYELLKAFSFPFRGVLKQQSTGESA